jgi:hypothetical protein
MRLKFCDKRFLGVAKDFLSLNLRQKSFNKFYEGAAIFRWKSKMSKWTSCPEDLSLESLLASTHSTPWAKCSIGFKLRLEIKFAELRLRFYRNADKILTFVWLDISSKSSVFKSKSGFPNDFTVDWSQSICYFDHLRTSQGNRPKLCIWNCGVSHSDREMSKNLIGYCKKKLRMFNTHKLRILKR